MNLHKIILLLLLCISTLLPAQKQSAAPIPEYSVTEQRRLDSFSTTVEVLSKESTQKAIQYCRQVTVNKDGEKSVLDIAWAWTALGKLNWKLMKMQEGIENLKMARQYYLLAGKKGIAGYCLSETGVYYFYSGQSDSAMKYYLQSIDELRHTGNKREYALAQYNLGNLFFSLKNYSRSRFYQNGAVETARSVSDTGVLINTLYALGKTYIEEKNLPLAFEKLQEAALFSNHFNRPSIAGMINSKLSVVALKLNKPVISIEAGTKGMEQALKAKDYATYMEACISLATVYGKTGNTAAKEKLLRLAMSRAKEARTSLFQGEVYRWLADGSYQLGEYRSAYEYLKTAVRIKDSLIAVGNNKLNTELEAKYQSTQKEKELSQKQLLVLQKDIEIQKSRNYMYFTLAGIVILILLATTLFLEIRNRRQRHKRELKNLEQQKELQLLQAVMEGEENERSRIAKDLHDGVSGTLAAVKMHFGSISSTNDYLSSYPAYQKGMQLLNEATQEIRKTSHNLMPEVLFRYGLDKALQRYCNNINNSKSMVIEYDCLGTIDRFSEAFELSVYRIVQELIANIIKHSKATHSLVQLCQQEDLLTINIEDNGVGFSPEIAENDGMGLVSLKKRVMAMNGKIEIFASEQNGVSFYLEFELNKLQP